MIKLDTVTRGSKNVVFSFIQQNDAWQLTGENITDPFYTENSSEIIKIQKQYAKIVNADYYFFKGNVVEYVKSKIPNLIKLRLFVQYYDLARYLFMAELCKKYDKVLYIDTDIIPVTNDSIFDEVQDENTLYIGKIMTEYGKDCPFYGEMENYNKILKDKTYKYNGHVNHGVIVSSGNAAASFIENHIDKLMTFTKTIDKEFFEEDVIYIGIEHYYMYMLGTTDFNKLGFNLRYFREEGWNVYSLSDDFPGFTKIYNGESKYPYRFIHFCGSEAKEAYKKEKPELKKLIEKRIGEYTWI